MGRGIQLTEIEWDALDRLRFSMPSADVFRNCLIILMSDSRETIAGIAVTVGCSAETVKRIRKLYRQGGLQALQPIKPPGRPSQATPAFLATMKQAVLTSPLGLGYGFSTGRPHGWPSIWPRPPELPSATINCGDSCISTGFPCIGPSIR